MPEQRWIRGSLIWIVLIVAVLAMWATFVGNDGAPTVRSIGQVAQEVRDGKAAARAGGGQPRGAGSHRQRPDCATR